VEIDKKAPGQPVVGVVLRGADITDDDLECLQGFPELKRLDISGTGITNDGVVHLKKLRNLEFLNISKTRVTGTGVKELREVLPNLQIT
jgi:hypothetical protein